MKPNLNNRLLFWGMLSLYFLFLAYEVLHSDYVFTDEAYRLWQNINRQGIFQDFHTQGRTFGGLMCRWIFGLCHKVADVKYIRLFSLCECVLLALVLYGILKRLQRRLLPAISDELIYLSVSLVAASLSVANWIGWGVSTIIFVPAILSLAAGMILFESIQRSSGIAVFPGFLALSGVLVLSVTGLFFYQSPYPLLLLPFYFLFLTGAYPASLQNQPVASGPVAPPVSAYPVSPRQNQLMAPDRLLKTVYWGVLVYLIILAIYFGLFRLGLKWTGLPASDRTALATDPMERLSFFFSYPINQAFNGNLFFDVRSIVSQLMFPVLCLTWVIILLRISRGSTRTGHAVSSPGKTRAWALARYIFGLLAFWVLGFLPQLAGHEAYGPYRTMLVMTLMVFLALVYTALSLIRTARGRTLFSFALVLALLLKGAYNYKVYIADPLRKEYQVIRQELRAHYNEHIQEVVFIRPYADGFEASLGIQSYKDEFGLPSTNKDWVPDPLVRQQVYEITGSRQRADALNVIQYEYVKMEEWKGAVAGKMGVRVEALRDSAVLNRGNVLYINAPKLLNDLK